jgi:hypothetical protein
MKSVLDSIEAMTKAFANLEYFRILEGPPQRSDVEIMARGLSFFVLSFQDMLRINADKVKDPAFTAIVLAQRDGDAGHDNWFLSDLRRLGIEPNVRWLFGKSHERTRDTAYEIIAELHAAPDDCSRVVVGLVLEATSSEYFRRVHHFFAGLGLVDGYRFFGREHWQAEQGHDALEGASRAQLEAVTLSESTRQQALATAARVFRSVSHMCEDLADRMLEARAAGERPSLERASS